MAQDTYSIPATELRKGMQTFRRDSRNGKLRRDVTIGDPFTTSGSIQPLAFHTVGPDGKRTGTVIYAHCASVIIARSNRRLAPEQSSVTGNRSNRSKTRR